MYVINSVSPTFTTYCYMYPYDAWLRQSPLLKLNYQELSKVDKTMKNILLWLNVETALIDWKSEDEHQKYTSVENLCRILVNWYHAVYYNVPAKISLNLFTWTWVSREPLWRSNLSGLTNWFEDFVSIYISMYNISLPEFSTFPSPDLRLGIST